MRRLAKVMSEAEVLLKNVGEADLADRLAASRQGLASAEFRVIVFGEFSRGKSTLINALLDRVVLPAKAMPTTGHVTRVAWGPRNEVKVRLGNGEDRTCPLDRLGSFSTLDINRRARDDVSSIDVLVDCPLLRDGLVLVDTPGVCDPGGQTERALKAIASADLVLLVLNATQLLTQYEQELAADWLRGRLGKPVVPVVNWMNIVESHNRDEQRERMDLWSRRHMGAELGRSWYEVNAHGALLHALGAGPASTDDFGALRSALFGLSEKRRGVIRERSRRAQVGYEVADIRTRNGQVIDRLRLDSDRVARERAEELKDLRRGLREFDALAKLKRESVIAVTTSAFDGGIELLTDTLYQGETKDSLEANANPWYELVLTQAVAETERRGDAALLELTGAGLRRPDPLTIKERVALQARVVVGAGTVQTPDAEILANNISVFGAGAIGQSLIPIPGVGFLAGMVGGALLTRLWDRTDERYVAAYSAQARKSWGLSKSQVLELVAAEFDVRAASLRAQISRRLQAVKSASAAEALAGELGRREELDAALESCERELGSD